MPRISESTIEKIKRSADIVDVISDYVDLQPAGKSMKGLCPFHNEKTPSFFVSKERQIFNCFGCGEKGNAITFIQKYKNMTYPEALEHLAGKYNIPLEYNDEIQVRKQKTNYYEINELAQKFYTLNLLSLETGKAALDYLATRNIDTQTIEYFELGFAPNDGQALYQKLTDTYIELDLLNAGLINKNTDGYYDIFRNRIMFPIRNELGKLVAFSGRTFGNNQNPAKYVNTAQTEIFTKGEVIYNLDKAAPYIKKNNRIVLMEGYMDVIAAYSAGVKEAVCSMGTQLTHDQAQLLKKYADEVVICFDGDRAGQEATFKAIRILENSGININICALPEGLDPDEYIKKYGLEKFRNYLQEKLVDKYDFVFEMMVKDLDLKKPSEIERVKNNIFKYYQRLNSSLIQEMYFKRFAQMIDTSYEALNRDFQEYLLRNELTTRYKEKRKQVSQKVVYTKQYTAERLVINYYLYEAEYRDLIKDKYGLMQFKDMNLLIMESLIDKELVGSYEENIAELKASFDPAKTSEIEKRLLRKNHNYCFEELEQCIDTLSIAKLQSRVEELESRIKNIDYDSDKTTYNNLVLQKTEIIKQIKKIEGRTNGKKENSRFFDQSL